jgi:hypothetical protein
MSARAPLPTLYQIDLRRGRESALFVVMATTPSNALANLRAEHPREFGEGVKVWTLVPLGSRCVSLGVKRLDADRPRVSVKASEAAHAAALTAKLLGVRK